MSEEFTFTITSDQLSKGLRPSKRVNRDSKYLVESAGAVGRDGTLVAIDELTRLATTEITDSFPFPQIFVFTNTVIVCSLLSIYEWMGDALHFELSIPSSLAGGPWTAVDFYDYIYLSNGDAVVIKNAGSNVYELSTVLPHSTCACNFNGQVIIGAPNVSGLGANMVISCDPVIVTTEQYGNLL